MGLCMRYGYNQTSRLKMGPSITTLATISRKRKSGTTTNALLRRLDYLLNKSGINKMKKWIEIEFEE